MTWLPYSYGSFFLDSTGPRPTNGHYVTYVLNPNRHWSLYNDATLTSDIDVTNLFNGVEEYDEHGKKRPYHLTYCRNDMLERYFE